MNGKGKVKEELSALAKLINKIADIKMIQGFNKLIIFNITKQG